MSSHSRKRIELQGKRFGRWVVIAAAGYDPLKRILWHCRCDCGQSGLVRSADLRLGRSKSCGCYRTDVASAQSQARWDKYHEDHPIARPAFRPSKPGKPRVRQKPKGSDAATDLVAAWPEPQPA